MSRRKGVIVTGVTLEEHHVKYMEENKLNRSALIRKLLDAYIHSEESQKTKRRGQKAM